MSLRFLAVSTALTLSVAVASAQQVTPFKVVAEKDLATTLAANPKMLIVDARMPDERAGWSLKCERCTTVNAPFGFGADDKGKAAGLKSFVAAVAQSKPLAAAKLAGQEVLVVCLAGGRSGAAATEMVKLGYKPVLLDGGLQALKDERNIKGAKPKS